MLFAWPLFYSLFRALDAMRLREIFHALWEGRVEPPGGSRRAWEWAVLLFAMVLFGVGVVALIALLGFADAYLPKDRAAQRSAAAWKSAALLNFGRRFPTLNSKGLARRSSILT